MLGKRYVRAAGSEIGGASDSNISAVQEIERQAIASRSPGEKIGDFIARHAGRLWFTVAHAVWFAIWIGVSDGKTPGIHAFDPFPYPFLTFILSLESIFLSLFILMSQNRANKQADSRSHLDLQINLLAEQESTAALHMLHKLCDFHGLNVPAVDEEVERLKQSTKPEALLQEIKKSLPDQ